MADAGERKRRETWHLKLKEAAAEMRARAPEPWQVELAAWILAGRPKVEWWAHHLLEQNMWVFAHTTASDLADQMKADGRLDQHGMLPKDER